MPLFNGTPASLFDKSEAEVLDIPNKPDTTHTTLDSDKGTWLYGR